MRHANCFPSLKYFTRGGQFCPNYSFFGGSGAGFGPEGQTAPYSQPFSSRATTMLCPKCPHQLPQPGHRVPHPGRAPAAALLAELQSQVGAPRSPAVISSDPTAFLSIFFSFPLFFCCMTHRKLVRLRSLSPGFALPFLGDVRDLTVLT